MNFLTFASKYNLLKTILTILSAFLINKIYAQEYFNVLKYGAKTDGITKNTFFIKKAIEAADKKGGGTIYFPTGIFLTGPIHLKSNITILIDAGATIRFSDDFDDYLPMVQSRWEGTDVINFSPLFYAYKAENIAIKGRGKIDGQGKKWWDFHHKLYSQPKDSLSKWQKEFKLLNKDVLLPEEPGMILRGFCRPPFIQPMYCKNVLIEGISIVNSPFWTVNPEFCDNVTVTGVTIINPISPNTDGINPESCSNVHISDCHISVGDDCITIKSGRDRAGRKMNTPAENYTITNCTMLSGHGGVVIGSEMSGGVKKITISNCVFDGTDRGIRIKTSRGRGGVVEDIRVSNIIMKNIKKEALTLNMLYDKSTTQPVSERTPQFKNIHISSISGNAYQAATLLGIEEMPIQNISFTDINLNTKLGFLITYSQNIKLSNIQLTNESGSSVTAENSILIEIDGLKNITPQVSVPVIELKNVQNAFIHNCFQPVATSIFTKVEGEKTSGIKISSNCLVQCKEEVVVTPNVPAGEVSK